MTFPSTNTGYCTYHSINQTDNNLFTCLSHQCELHEGRDPALFIVVSLVLETKPSTQILITYLSQCKCHSFDQRPIPSHVLWTLELPAFAGTINQYIPLDSCMFSFFLSNELFFLIIFKYFILFHIIKIAFLKLLVPAPTKSISFQTQASPKNYLHKVVSLLHLLFISLSHSSMASAPKSTKVILLRLSMSFILSYTMDSSLSSAYSTSQQPSIELTRLSSLQHSTLSTCKRLNICGFLPPSLTSPQSYFLVILPLHDL